MSQLAYNIKLIRTKVYEMTQAEFASLFNLNRSNIASYEGGKAEPSILFLIKISEKTNINIKDLYVKKINIDTLLTNKMISSNQIKGNNNSINVAGNNIENKTTKVVADNYKKILYDKDKEIDRLNAKIETLMEVISFFKKGT